MIFAVISFPLGLLCLYLGCLGWRKNPRIGATLLVFALLNLGFAFAVTLLAVFLSHGLGAL